MGPFESHTGYALQFQVYIGKIQNVVENLGYRVVFDLVRRYPNKGYRIYFDNFYTSVKLVEDQYCIAEHLLLRNCEIQQKGEAVFWKCDNITAVTCQDKELFIYFLHFMGMQWWKSHPEEESVTKPEMITNYNKFMNVVDKCDQLLHNYNIVRKSKKWWSFSMFALITPREKKFNHFLTDVLTQQCKMYQVLADHQRQVLKG